MDEIYRFGQEVYYRVGHMGRQEWLLIALCVVIFGYYCTKME